MAEGSRQRCGLGLHLKIPKDAAGQHSKQSGFKMMKPYFFQYLEIDVLYRDKVFFTTKNDSDAGQHKISAS
jgi:hypothetical protein